MQYYKKLDTIMVYALISPHMTALKYRVQVCYNIHLCLALAYTMSYKLTVLAWQL